MSVILTRFSSSEGSRSIGAAFEVDQSLKRILMRAFADSKKAFATSQTYLTSLRFDIAFPGVLGSDGFTEEEQQLLKDESRTYTIHRADELDQALGVNDLLQRLESDGIDIADSYLVIEKDSFHWMIREDDDQCDHFETNYCENKTFLALLADLKGR